MSAESRPESAAEAGTSDAPTRVGPRSELKFHLDAEATAAALAWCSARLAPDAHAAGPEPGLYFVESVYFDTPERHGVEDPAFPKYRARRYDGDDTSLHLEEKFSHSPRVWKRRQALTPAALEALVRHGAAARQGQGLGAGGGGTAALAGHRWFAERFARLRLAPTLLVGYARTAFVGAGDLRVTFDRDIEVVETDAAGLFATPAPRRRLDVVTLLEVKFMGAPPPLARDLCARHGEPIGFSKYRSGMRGGEREAQA